MMLHEQAQQAENLFKSFGFRKDYFSIAWRGTAEALLRLEQALLATGWYYADHYGLLAHDETSMLINLATGDDAKFWWFSGYADLGRVKRLPMPKP